MEDSDISASQLSARLFAALNLPVSYAQKVNLNYDGEERDEKLNLIAYDMLFGDRYLYGGEEAATDNEMQMGILPITIESVKNVDDHVVVTGENFNSYSTVFVDGDMVDTTYIDDTTLMVENKNLSGGEEVKVVQMTESHRTLGETAIFSFK
jgi:hypothetical protein